MRGCRLPTSLAFALMLGALAATMPSTAAPGQSRGRAQAGGPPHAWLFGVSTGGLFPVLDGMAAQDCRTQPTVVFSQDVLAHATLTGTGMTQRVIETARASPTGAEFRLTPDPADPAGFGCNGADVLHVARESNGAISFPHCAAFPYPLQHCAGR